MSFTRPVFRSPDFLILSGPSLLAALGAFCHWQTKATVVACLQMWWIWVASLIEAVGLLLLWLLLLMAALRSEKELCYQDEAQVRALANWRLSGCRGWVATECSRRILAPRACAPSQGGQL